MQAELKPYLAYSALAHAALVGALAMLVRGGGATAPQVYRIDFIGPTQTIVNRDLDATAGSRGAAAAVAPPAKGTPPPPLTRDAFQRREAAKPLPRPSFLAPDPSSRKVETAASAQTRPSTAGPAPSAATGTGPAAAPAGGEAAAVVSDMPNFPYPWYISQVRTLLWGQWSQRMPPGGGEAMVMFTILRTGTAVDIRVEASSGDSGFDYTALSAVQDSTPFPPLPPGFSEKFLKVHVRFASK